MMVQLPTVRIPCSRILLTGFASGHSGVIQTTTELKKVGIAVAYFEDVSTATAREFNPDLIVVYSSRPRYLAGAVPSIRTYKCPKALWHCDLRPPTALAGICQRVFDGVFLPWTGRFNDSVYSLGDCNVSAWAHELRTKCWYMSQAAELRQPPIKSEATHRVVFVGDLDLPCHIGRKEICSALKATVFGSHNRHEKRAISKASRSLYASSLFSLSMSPPATAYTSNRTYNILAWRGLLLLQRYPECEMQFAQGKHALIFSSPRQALRLVTKFAQEKEVAEQIRMKGWQLAASRHTYAHRVLNIAANIYGTSSDFWGYL